MRQSSLVVITCFIICMVHCATAVQKQCGSFGTEKKYCLPKSECEPQSLIELRTNDCEIPTHSCCTKKAAIMEHYTIKSTLTECDSQKGYCVGSNMCTVRTYRLRTNRCPSLEEVCCPKQSVAGLSTTTAAPIPTTSTTSRTTSKVRTTTKVPTFATTPVVATIDTPTRTSPNDSKTDTAAQDDNLKFDTTNTSSIGAGGTGSSEISDSNKGANRTKTGLSNKGASLNNKSHPTYTKEPQTTVGYEKPDPSEVNYIVTTESASKVWNLTPTSVPITPKRTDSTTTPKQINSVAPNLRPEFRDEPFSFNGCGQRNRYGVVESTVQDDKIADYGEYPWMAAFFQVNRDTNDKRYCCNGALIERFIVITTANCFSNCGSNPANMVVRLGEWIMNSTTEPIPHEDFQVLQMVKHPYFQSSSLINNIAIVALESDVDYKPTIQPICLPHNEEPILSTQHFIATGWGATVEQTIVGVKTPSDVLKRLDLHYEPFTTCVKHIEGRTFNFHDSFACTTTQNEERPCKGDAGAPVFLERRTNVDEFYLYGLVSWGWSCHQTQRKETVVTVVEKFQSWINATIQELQVS